MKNLLFFVLIFIFIGSGCSIEKRCTRLSKKCPAKEKIIVKDSIIYKEKIIIRDSIIKIPLPKDTVKIYKKIYIDRNNLAQLDTIVVENGIIGAFAFVNNSHLGLVAYVSDSSLYFALDSARIEITRYKEKIHSKQTTKTITVTHNSKFANFTIWWFIISVILLLLTIYIKLKKKMFNL